MFIDSHTHLSKNDYENIEDVVIRAKDNNVNYLIVSCCTKNDILEGLSLLEKYDNIFLTIGLHPSEADIYSENDLALIKDLVISNKKIIGIGEIGLDYYYGKENEDAQKELFYKQLKLAEELNKPVVIHSRDAVLDTQNMLNKFKLKGIIHCFSGSLEVANWYVKNEYLIGIGGVLTFKNSKLPAVVQELPLESIVLETDSPYLAPVPYRGSKNESKNIPIIAEEIARIKCISIEQVGNVTTNNVITLFDLSDLL